MENLALVAHTPMTLESLEKLSPYDVLRHFNTHIYPGIKNKIFPQAEVSVNSKAKISSKSTQRSLFNLFKKKHALSVALPKEEAETETKNDRARHELLGREVAKGIFEFVVGNHTRDIKRINLFLEVLYTEMTTTAYCNSWLDFHHCAETFESDGLKDKSVIIQEALKLCDEKLWKGLTTISFAEDHLIFENGYGTTLQSKKDFFAEE